MDDTKLREQAREAIRAGTLPNRPPERMWGGPGLGDRCTVCAHPVMRDEMGFELAFTREGDEPGLPNHHLHVRCFAAWESERDDLEAAALAISPGGPAGLAAGANSGSAHGGALQVVSSDGTLTACERDHTYRQRPA